MSFYVRPVAAGLLVGVLFFAGCDDSSVPTATAAQAGAPVISSITTNNEGNNLVTLRVNAKDPNNSPLSFLWSTNDGQLSATTSAAVQWRVPSKAGTYSVAVSVTNAKGQKVSGTQKFTVASDGSAVADGTVQVGSSGSGGGNGQFDIPNALTSPVASPALALGGVAVPQANGILVGLPTQPIATLPLPAPSPVKPVIQTLATPTVTPPPVTPPPSPLPTPKPPPPEPGVPVPPPVTWHQYDPTKMPKANNLKALHFLDLNTGYLVGAGSTVLFYKRTDPATDPSLVFRNTLIPGGRSLNRVHFTSLNNGYICGEAGLVVRTSDGGQTWQNISVPAPVSDLSGMVVFNDQIIEVCDTLGNVFRTESANATDPTKVNWVRQPTQPAAHPENQSHLLLAGAGFQDTTLSYWVGDGVWRLDSDNPDPNKVWTKVFSIDTGDGATNPGDVRANSIQMTTANEMWVGLGSGSLIRTQDAGATWTKLKRTEFKNREFNGNFLFLTPPTAIGAISLLDHNNAFITTGGNAVYDTRSAAVDWRTMPTNGVLTDVQINVDPATAGGFTGWGVTTGEKGFFIYRSGP